MRDARDIEKDHEARRAERRFEEGAWRDIARIIRPDDQDFDRNSATDPDNYDVFDSTPLYALEDFVGGLWGDSINPADRWMELTTGNDDLDRWGPVQAWLWRRVTRHFQSLSPAVSNFYVEAQAWFGNLGAFGNSFLYQEEWRQGIIERALPLGECFIETDAAGNLSAFSREFKWTGRQVKSFFRERAPEVVDENKKYSLIHAVYPNPDFMPGRLGPRGMPFASTYVSTDAKGWRRDGGYYELPFHPLFWTKRSGKAWARGRGHVARADMNTNNEMARAGLVDAQFAAEPIIRTAREGLFTAADIMPNAILEGALSDQGKAQVDFMQRGDNPMRAEQKAQQVRDAIREAFFFSLMQVVNRPQMTATEFMGWKEERLRLLGPSLVRVQQGLASFVARRDRIMDRAGQFDDDPPPPELEGRNVAVKFVSPLAKAQQVATGRAVLQWIGALGQLAEASGDQTVFDVVNKDGVSRSLHHAMVGLPDVINDQREVEAIRAARAEAMQAQQQIEQAAQEASVFADVAHAEQALSAGRGRGRPA